MSVGSQPIFAHSENEGAHEKMSTSVVPLRVPCVDDDRHTLRSLLGSLKHCDRWFPLTLDEDFYKQNPLAPALHKALGVELLRLDELLGRDLWVRSRRGRWERCLKAWVLPNYHRAHEGLVKLGTVSGGPKGGSMLFWVKSSYYSPNFIETEPAHITTPRSA